MIGGCIACAVIIVRGLSKSGTVAGGGERSRLPR